MDKKELELLIENFPDKPVLRRYKTYIENKDKSFTQIMAEYEKEIEKSNKIEKSITNSIDKFYVLTYNNITNTCKITTQSMVKEGSLWQNRY